MKADLLQDSKYKLWAKYLGIILFLLYISSFSLFYEYLGNGFMAFPLLPIIFITWSFGMLPSLLTVLIVLFVNYMVLTNYNMDPTSIMFANKGGLTGVLALLSSVPLVGILRANNHKMQLCIQKISIKEKALEKSKKQYQSIIDNTLDIIYSIDAAGKVIFVSSRVKDYGYEIEDVIGHNIMEFVYPADRGSVQKDFEKTIEDGSEFPTSFRLMKKDGTYVYAEEIGKAFNDEDRGFIINGIVRDVSARRQTELENHRLLESLAYSEKMASLGKLAGGVAHEINNPLTTILTNTEILIEDIKDEFLNASLVSVLQGSKRIRDTINNFMAFAKNRAFTYESYYINNIIKEIISEYNRADLGSIDIELNLAQELQKIKLSKYYIKESFSNIVCNAIESIKNQNSGKQGLITISTWMQGKDILVSFMDNGLGIDSNCLERVFDIDFTSKGKQGTGFGLAVAKMVITQHNGKIEVYSNGLGYGAEFKIILPITTN